MEFVKGFPEVEELQVVKIGEDKYLCECEDFKLKRAFLIETKEIHFASYVKACNVDETIELKIGDGLTTLSRKLTPMEKTAYTTELKIMNHAIKHAENYNQNAVFDKLRRA